MESLEGPIVNPCKFEDQHEHVQCCYEGDHAVDLSYGGGWTPIVSTESLRFGDRMPSTAFLHMLGGRDQNSSTLLATDSNLFLLSLQQQQQGSMEARVQVMELESCTTNVSEAQSPAKSETGKKVQGRDERHGEPGSLDNCKDRTSDSSSQKPGSIWQTETKTAAVREKKKRKRSRPRNDTEKVESQRMTHIAVERNRRKQMNEHLSVLRALMPPSFIHKGDQASIIGGAIDFVKELEQLLQALQAQNRRKQSEDQEGYKPDTATFFMPPQNSSSCNYRNLLDNCGAHHGGRNHEFMAENRSVVANVEVTLIQTHANVKVRSRRRPGELLNAISTLEGLDIAILHLNVTTVNCSVLYSFNLKIGEACKLGSADEIAKAVHHIFD